MNTPTGTQKFRSAAALLCLIAACGGSEAQELVPATADVHIVEPGRHDASPGPAIGAQGNAALVQIRQESTQLALPTLPEFASQESESPQLSHAHVATVVLVVPQILPVRP